MNSAKNAPKPAKLTPNLGLRHRNSFGLDSTAELAYEITSADQLPALMKELGDKKLAWRVLGGGSNVILPESLPGATLLINILGQEIIHSDEESSWLSVGAGVNWHELVSWTLEQDLPALENLALIPGTVGAAPIQNIGAYGLEVGEYIDSIEAFDSVAHAFVTLPQEACHFAYRDSYFKQNPNRFIVTKVFFKIPKAWQARLQYADLAKQFAESNSSPSAKQIFDVVCAIRSSKLPDPKVIGNAGSFFQNPIVSTEQCEQLSKQFPNLVSYADSNGKRKLAAGWLIDQCGFKGKRVGPVGVYEKQALVLVNHGGGTSTDILNLAKCIQEEVLGKFGVKLEIEPNILRKISNGHVYIQLNYWQYDNVMSQYPVKLTKDGSNILVTFRDVPEAITFGANQKEALKNAVDALETGLSLYIDSGKNWPKPSAAIDSERLVFISKPVTTKPRLKQDRE